MDYGTLIPIVAARLLAMEMEEEPSLFHHDLLSANAWG